MSTSEQLTEQLLKKGIWVTAAAIVAVVIALGGYWYYLNRPSGEIPPVLQQSIDQAKADVTKNPNNLDAHVKLAQFYIQAKMYDDAIEECTIILKIDKESEFGMSLMGVAYQEKGNTDKAVTYYKKAIEVGEKKKFARINPAVNEARFRLGQIYLDRKKWDDAINIFKPMVERNAIDADSKYYLGLAFFGKGQYDAAIEQFEAAIAFVPDYAEANYALGQTYEKKGDRKKAAEAYKAALKYKPDYAEAKTALARVEK